MTIPELLASTADDPNWWQTETANFVLLARHQVLRQGRSDEPVRGVPRVKSPRRGFHGIPEDWLRRIGTLLKQIDARYFAGRALPNRKSATKIAIVFWDAEYDWPIPSHAGPLGVHKPGGIPKPISLRDPVTIPNEDDRDAAGDFTIVLTVPIQYYWGELRQQWLGGALAHELMHIWTSWIGPSDLDHLPENDPWRLLDEASAVWAEYEWTQGGQSSLDYVVPWTEQAGISLYGAWDKDSRFGAPLSKDLGYQQFPFLRWLNDRDPDVIEHLWRYGAGAGNPADPWACLDAVLRKRGESFGEWFGKYSGEAYTTAFLEKICPLKDAGRYLKGVEEVVEEIPTDRELRILPLSKRAFCLRLGGRGCRVTLREGTPGFGLHAIEEDGNGRRKAVLKSSDGVPPYDIQVPPAQFAVLVVYCASLAHQPGTAPSTPIRSVKAATLNLSIRWDAEER